MRVAMAALVLAGFLVVSQALGAAEIGPPPPPAPPGVADSRPAPEEACKKTACRPAKLVVVRVNKDKTLGLGLSSSPYVDERGVLTIYPGERLVFHLEIDGGRLRPPAFVREQELKTGDISQLSETEKARFNANPNDPNTLALQQSRADMKVNGVMSDRLAKEPPGTLFVEYRQAAGGAMILETGHNLPQALKFDATISYPGGRHERTSICTVLPNLAGIETWGGPLLEMALSNFRTVEPQKDANGNSQVTCD
jgi:hypothetical protein